uniref:Rho-GAP domain-containing protein n=1 Tax=Moschus moschiferus TaxID=68415 RepID=A0A8C6EED1_MOSMO
MKVKDTCSLEEKDRILKSRGILFPPKFCLVKAMVFPVVMYLCESWTIKKAECLRINVFELWCWRRLLRVPWTARMSNQSILKEISPEHSLEGLMLKENSTMPKFVKLCIEHIVQYGLDVDGIYRVSGNPAVIQKLRFAVKHDEKLDLKDSKWEDIHVITGALKVFFQELPEPLFTFNHFNDFVNAIKQLPKSNQDTVQILFRDLKRVIQNAGKNQMTYQSIVIVFGPSLLKPEKETGNIAVHTVYQNQIIRINPSREKFHLWMLTLNRRQPVE